MKGFTFDLQRFTDTVTEENAVAQIGDSYYETLQAAVDAVKSGGTVTLLKDATGSGVRVDSGKNFTLDFGGHTYNVDGTTVGSAGTETQAFQLLKDSNITFKDGTITSSVAKMLVQNYSNLTLENMTLDGSKLVGDAPFTSSNNNGTINVTGNTSIIAKTGGYAFDVSFANTSYPTGPQVTIDTTGEIGAINFNTWNQGGDEFKGSLTINNGTIGDITVDNDALNMGAVDKIKINGGKFTVANKTLGITTKVTAENESDNYFTTADLAKADTSLSTATIDGETKYFTTQALADTAKAACVAKIGDDKYFSTLQAAVNAVDNNGGTVTLLKDATGSGVRVDSGKNFTLDFGGHAYTIVDTPVGSTGTQTIGFQLLQNSEVTFKDGRIAAGAYGATNNPLLRLIQNYANLTLENMDIDGSGLLVNSDGRKLVAGVDNVVTTVSTNNGTLNLTGTTSIEAIETRYYQPNGEIVATTSGTALGVGYAAESYPNGAQVKVNTTGAIDGINFGTWGQGGTTFAGSLTINKGTIGDITIDDDALALGAVDKIKINGGTFANSAIKADAKLLVVDNVLVAEGWNSTSDSFFYVAAHDDESKIGTKLITVSGIDSPDEIKFDDVQKVFAVPNGATTSDLADGYKIVTVDYDGSTANVKTDDDGIEITENLLAGTVTKISASGNTNTVYISGGDQVTSIVGGKGDDTLAGSNDNLTLTGGQGSDIFVAGEKITITDYGTDDKISVNAAPTSFKFSGSNLVLDFDNDNTLTVNGAKNKAITFVSGEGSTVRTYSATGAVSEGKTVTLDENFKGSGYNISKVDDVTQIDASKVTVKVNLVGNNLGNTLKGGSGNDSLTGGTGNDEFTGNDGSDTFIYSGGDDTITDYRSTDNDTVKLNKGHSIQSATFGDTDAVIKLNGDNSITLTGATNETVTVKDAANKVWSYNKDFTAQGNSVTLQSTATTFDASSDAWKTLVTIDGSAANADITGNAKNNVITGNGQLDGGNGNDTLTGGDDADTFIYTAGKDVITNYAEDDTVKLGGELQFTDITAAKVSGQKVTFTVGNGSLAFNDNPAQIKLVDAQNNEATLSTDGVVTDTTKYLLNGTKTATADSELILDAQNVKNAVTITAAEDSTIFGNAGKTVYNYAGGAVTIENYAAGDKINYGKLAITDVTTDKITFGEGDMITLVDHDASDKVQLISTNDKGKSVNSTVYLGEGAIYNDTTAKATGVSVTSDFAAEGKVKTVTALGTDAIKITGNNIANTLTANDAGDTLDGGTGNDILIGGKGADVFIHDKITGTTTINGYTSTDAIDLGDGLTVVGSAYSPSSKNGTLTLTVEGTTDAGKSSTSKIVIKSDDFTKADAPTYGTIVLEGTSTSYGKNAIYYADEIKLLSTFSGKFTATESSKVDGSDVTKTLTLQGSKADDTLTGGATKSTLTGGKGDDELHGGSGKDVFTYATGDGKDVIADFTYNDDKLKVSTGKLISDISQSGGKLTFDMTDDGSVTINDLQNNILLKANGTLYWFEGGELVTAKDTATKNKLSAIIKAPTDYAIVELDYGTNLVKDGLAKASATTFNATTFKKTT